MQKYFNYLATALSVVLLPLIIPWQHVWDADEFMVRAWPTTMPLLATSAGLINGLIRIAIPIIICSMAYRYKLLSTRLLFIFCIFMCVAGIGQLADTLMLYHPAYRLLTVINTISAAVSIIALVALIMAMPDLAALRTNAQIQAEMDQFAQSFLNSKEAYRLAAGPGGMGTWSWRATNNHIDPEKLTTTPYCLDTWSRNIVGVDHNLSIIDFKQLVHADDRGQVTLVISRNMSMVLDLIEHPELHHRNYIEDIECRIVRPVDQSVRWIVIRGSIIKEGPKIQLIGTVIDITDSKQHIVQLTESETRFRSLANAVSLMIFMVDDKYNITYWNRAIEEFSGVMLHTPNALLPHALIHPDDQERFDNDLAAYTEHVNTTGYYGDWRGEYRFRDVQEEYHWLLLCARPVWDDDSMIATGYVGTCVDITDRKEHEARLTDSERYWRVNFEMAGVGWNHIDLSTFRYVRVNPYFCELLGYTEAELLEKTVMDVTHPDDLPELLSSTQLVSASLDQRGFSMEKRYIRKDGSTVWTQLNAVKIDRDGVIVGQAVVVDISDRKQAEADVRLLANLTNQSHDAIIVRKFDGTIISWNLGAERLYGWTKEQAIGQITHILLHTVHPRPLDDLLVEAQAKGAWEGELIHTCMDGRVITVASRWAVDPSIGIEYLMETNIDITEQVRAENRLRDSERSFRLLAEASPQIVWSTFPDGKQEYINQRWLQFTGMTFEAMHQEGWLAAVHIDDRERVSTLWRHSMKTGEYFRSEHRFIGKDGIARWFLVHGVPFRDDTNKIVKWLGTCTDVDDQRQDVLRAQAANRAKDEFLAKLSHELRTPLTPVLGAISAVLDDPTTPLDFEMLNRNIQLEKALIDDLLDISSITAGKLTIDLHPIDLHRIIREAVDICQSEINSGHIEIHFSLAAKSSWIMGDAARMQQVIWNLVNNAIKFTPPCGAIFIRTRNDNGGIVLHVYDTGCGIDKESLPHIFKPFEQGSNRKGGLGLGLAIAKSIIDAHHGTINVSSEPGGTIFTINMKHVPAVLHDELPSGSGQIAILNTKRSKILLVEDHRDTLKLLTSVLRKRHIVHPATSVASALEALAIDDFDLLISDIGLPGLTGLELMQELRKVGNPIKGIALSGYGMRLDVQASLDAGFSMHLTKPVNVSNLELAIAKLLAEPKKCLTSPSNGSSSPAGPVS